jgi:hypothetical protein
VDGILPVQKQDPLLDDQIRDLEGPHGQTGIEVEAGENLRSARLRMDGAFAVAQ